nr:hypothetical protein [Acetobacter persici]
MRINKALTYTVPNTFDADALRRSRMAMRKNDGPDQMVFYASAMPPAPARISVILPVWRVFWPT